MRPGDAQSGWASDRSGSARATSEVTHQEECYGRSRPAATGPGGDLDDDIVEREDDDGPDAVRAGFVAWRRGFRRRIEGKVPPSEDASLDTRHGLKDADEIMVAMGMVLRSGVHSHGIADIGHTHDDTGAIHE